MMIHVFKQSRAIYFNPIWPVCLLIGFLLSSCNKEVQEPKHKNNGSNVLYFNIDGKGYLLRDRCLDFPSKKTGDIFGESDRKSLPRLIKGMNTGVAVYSLLLSFRFSNENGDRRSIGGIMIKFYQNTEGIYKLREANTSLLFYSPKFNKLLDLNLTSLNEVKDFKIEKYSSQESTISGSLTFSIKVADSNELTTCHIYFDVKTNNT